MLNNDTSLLIRNMVGGLDERLYDSANGGYCVRTDPSHIL